MKTYEWKKPLTNILKILCVLFIVFFISCSFYSCDLITAGRSILHEDIIFNDYYSYNEKSKLEIINEDTLYYRTTDLFNDELIYLNKWKYEYKEGVIFTYTGQYDDQDEEIVYEIVLLGTDKAIFTKYNELLYLRD